MTNATMRWRSLVVDDEPLARQTLTLLLAREGDFCVIGECAHGADAIATIETSRPDVIFLDVQMPEVDGLEVVRRVHRDHAPLVVFVTAYDQYALKAFEEHALDYLLKPFTDDRFAAVVERVRQRLCERHRAQLADRLHHLLTQTSARTPRSLLVRDSGRTLVIHHDEIVWIEAEDYCARLHLTARNVLVRDTLRALGEQLPAAEFIRLHRSAIANVAAIRTLEPVASGDQRVTLSDGTTLRVSRTHRAGVIAALASRR